MSVRPTIFFLAALATAPSGPAGAEPLGVGLTISASAPRLETCPKSGCLQILAGRFQPAGILGARPRSKDRSTCADAFRRIVVQGADANRQDSLVMLRCRALGLAPIVVGTR